MIALILLVFALTLGACFVRWLGAAFTYFEAIAIAIVIGLLGWTWLYFLVSLILPYQLSLPVALGLEILGTWVLWNRRATPATPLSIPGKDHGFLLWAGFSIIISALLGWLFWTHMLLPTPNGIMSSGSTWADLGLHSSLITHLASTPRMPLDLPLASGTHLTYPFLIDLLSTSFYQHGWDLHLALFVPGFLLACAFIQLLAGLSLRLFGSVSAAIIGISLALTNGSAIGLTAAWKDWQASHLSLAQFLGNLPQNYGAPSGINATFNNLVADLLLPQRAFAFGFGVFGVATILICATIKQPRRRYFWTIGVLAGIMPLSHPHTFIVLMTLIGCLTLWSSMHIHHSRWQFSWVTAKSWVETLGIACTIALPQIIWQQTANALGSGGHFAWGWTLGVGEALPGFIMHNFGTTIFALLGLPVVLVLKPSLRHFLPWYIPFLLLFLGAHIFAPQPFAYDNLKVIIYAYIIAMLFIGAGIVWLIRKHLWSIIVIIPLVCIWTIPGSLTILREFQRVDSFASLSDIELANWAKSRTPSDAIFLTTDMPNQPLATLAGRTIVFGYRGWLYNYNLDYEPRRAAVAAVLKDDAGITQQPPFQASYLAISRYESPEWIINQGALDNKYPVVFQNEIWTVYKLPLMLK